MYNRYIPQADGSFRRSQVPEASQRREPPREPPRQEQCPPPEPEPCPQQQQPPRQQRCQRPNSGPPPRQNQRPPRQEPRREGSVLQFLRQLLPKDFDTGDLLVVILLLLMAGDCGEDQNTALLTLALYLFM